MSVPATGMPLARFLSRLIWLSLLPLIILVTWFGIDHVRHLRADQIKEAEQIVNTIRVEIDHRLESLLAGQAVMASSVLLREGRLEIFYQRLLEFQRRYHSPILLTDADGQVLLDTRAPYGTPPPRLPRAFAEILTPQALAEGKPLTGFLGEGPDSALRKMLFVIPVLQDGSPKYLLVSMVDLDWLQQLVDTVELPAGHSLQVTNAGGQILARRPQAPTEDAASARQSTAALQHVSGFVRLDISRAAYLAPLIRATLETAVLLLLAVLTGWMGGRWAGRRLVGKINALTRPDETGQEACAIAEIGAARHLIETQRKALSASEQRYRSLFENSHSTMLLIDPLDGRIVDANPAAEVFYGWPRATLCGMNIRQINTLPPDEVARQMEHARESNRNIFHFRHRLANGEIRDVEVHSGAIEQEGRALLYSIIHDETRRLETERMLNKLAQAVEQSPESIAIADLDARLEYVNAAFVANTGYTREEVMGRNPRILQSGETPPETYVAMWETLTDGRIWEGEFINRRKDGSKYIEWARIAPIRQPDGCITHYLAIKQDITARRAAEQEQAQLMDYQIELNQKLEAAQNQVLQAEKMAAIGQLAAGVAHELNNPIGFVSSNLNSLDGYLRDIFAVADAYAAIDTASPACPCPELQEVLALKREKDFDFLRNDIFALLAESNEGLARVARIVSDLKDFSRAGDTSRQWVDLRQGLDSTLNIVWNELKYKCEVVKEYGDLPQVWCEPSQLNQVFMNLLVNASQAIADKGTITLTTGRQGDEVFVAIADTGEGIPPANLPRIFDPFFTTKSIGQGTGLGLSLSYGIVQKHHGRIEVQSEPGKGTTFTVWLPIRVADNMGAVPPAPTSGES